MWNCGSAAYSHPSGWPEKLSSCSLAAEICPNPVKSTDIQAWKWLDIIHEETGELQEGGILSQSRLRTCCACSLPRLQRWVTQSIKQFLIWLLIKPLGVCCNFFTLTLTQRVLVWFGPTIKSSAWSIHLYIIQDWDLKKNNHVISEWKMRCFLTPHGVLGKLTAIKFKLFSTLDALSSKAHREDFSSQL